MKKQTILLMIVILLSSKINAQRNTALLGGDITSIGVGLHTGFEGQILGIKTVAIKTGWSHSLFKPSVNIDCYYATIGYVYQIGKSYNAAMHSGYAYATKRIVHDHDYFGQDKKKTFIINFEAGKDIASGRIYLTAGYATKLFFGIGMRGYF